jgi:hypothetical protein
MPQQTKDGFVDVKDLIHYTTIHLNDFLRPDDSCFEIGELTKKESKQKETQAEHFQFYSTASHEHASHYIATEDTRSAQKDKGRLLHDIVRTMVTIADLEHGLSTMITEGKLSEDERTHIIDMVQRAFENPVVSQWFTPGLEVKTEAEILLPDGSIARPDRIVFDNGQVQVIDYKFGEFESEKDRRQVLRYCDQLHKMGYTSVKGFLWYVMLNKVTRC